jgi:RNase adaptor protein for sRNA GlmZ degradation
MLTVKIYSFSYIYSGIPVDETNNCGGFVFDCRFIYNPGRHAELINLTGKDSSVKNFLDSNAGMQEFLRNCFKIIDSAIDNYLTRDFTSLMVSFGCTGGRHRSVYAAERLNEYIKNKYHLKKVKTQLKHTNI